MSSALHSRRDGLCWIFLGWLVCAPALDRHPDDEWLIDQGAYFLVEDFTQSSYAPWCKVAHQILEDEVGHPEFGAKFLEEQVRKLGPERVQRALDKWWRVGSTCSGRRRRAARRCI